MPAVPQLLPTTAAPPFGSSTYSSTSSSTGKRSKRAPQQHPMLDEAHTDYVLILLWATFRVTTFISLARVEKTAMPSIRAPA